MSDRNATITVPPGADGARVYSGNGHLIHTADVAQANFDGGYIVCDEAGHILSSSRSHALMTETLQEIARGRVDCGRPIAGEKAQALARATLAGLGLDW